MTLFLYATIFLTISFNLKNSIKVDLASSKALFALSIFFLCVCVCQYSWGPLIFKKFRREGLKRDCAL